MRATIYLTIGTALAVNADPQKRDLSAYSFADFTGEFNKSYSPDEHARRELVFARKLAAIMAHNAGDSAWVAGVNRFTDWTDEELSSFARGMRSQHKLPLSGMGSAWQPTGKDIPASVDWRNKSGVVTAVKDQGDCGSCWAFSTVETLESHYAIATGNAAPVMSEQELVDCMPNPNECGGTGGCNGGTQMLGFNYTSYVGITTEESYPYKLPPGHCVYDFIKPVAKNSGFVKPPVNNYTALIDALANIGPVAISLAAASFAFSQYSHGILDDAEGCGYDMDHAVQLVGYGEENGVMYIRIKRFGEDREPCGVDTTPSHGEACKGDDSPRTYCGICGLLGSSSYPTGMHAM